MPPLPPLEHTALIRVVMEQDSHYSQNVLHIAWGNGATATDSDMNTLAENVHVMYAGLMDGTLTGGTTYISESVTLKYATATDLTTPSSAFGQYTNSVAGAASQVALANAAVLISHHVNTRFRGGHCRTYLPGVTPDNTTDGRTWIAGAVTALQSWWTTQMGDILAGAYANIGDLELVMASYYSGKVRRETAVYYPVVDSTVDSVIRSQRRRVRNTPTTT